jgi:hypothetical protein
MNKRHTLKMIKHPLKDLLLEMLEGYIKEGERQDGKGFWEHYSSVSEFAEDFSRHCVYKDGLER